MNFVESFQVLGTIIAALIGAIALIKSSNSNISDKISRTQWAFEMYISFTGICLVSNSDDDYKKYKAFYYVFYAYSDERFKSILKSIDKLISDNKKQTAQIELTNLIDKYYDTYNLKKFGLKSKISATGMKRRIKTIFKTELTEKDFKQY